MNQSIQKAFPKLPERLSGLGELAYNLWWSWHPEGRMLFKMIDRQIWKGSIHNPVKMLKELPIETFEKLEGDTDYLRYYDAVIARFRDYMNTKGDWFLENVQTSAPLPIAYFSAEYGLHRSLPFYAGGLGFLAGDHIKECSDLGIPIVAIGFMYPGGYVRQKIRDDGWQEGTDQPIDREIVLGMGGYQVLSALGIEHFGIHLNEGHPAFAILEGIREIMEQGFPPDEWLRNIPKYFMQISLKGRNIRTTKGLNITDESTDRSS